MTVSFAALGEDIVFLDDRSDTEARVAECSWGVAAR